MQLMALNGFVNDNDLIALIHLINIARKNFKNLYDIKYHMFIKAPDGAFISIGSHKDLSLVTVNQINGFKAF